MKHKDYKKLIEQVRSLPGETILAAANRCDGHTIFKPEAFLDAGLPKDVVEHLTRTHGSDGSPKGTIFVKGEPVKELAGVYGLDMLRFLADALGVKYTPAMGRGFEAQNICAALKQYVDSAPVTKPVSS